MVLLEIMTVGTAAMFVRSAQKRAAREVEKRWLRSGAPCKGYILYVNPNTLPIRFYNDGGLDNMYWEDVPPTIPNTDLFIVKVHYSDYYCLESKKMKICSDDREKLLDYACGKDTPDDAIWFVVLCIMVALTTFKYIL